MNDQLFRKKSIDKISSPDQLTDYLRVANPGVWMIRQCDRMIILDGGKIAEDGSYEELLGKDSLFADLVKRQLLDKAQNIGKTTVC